MLRITTRMKAVVPSFEEGRPMSKPMENGYNGAAGASSIMSDEKIGSIFGSDPLLTTQFLQNVRRKTVLEPKTRLMVAILEDAIDCFQTNLLARGVTNVR